MEGSGDNLTITVNYQNCDPQPDDWIGIYECIPDGLDEFKYHPNIWLWTCYDSVCANDEDNSQGTVVFNDNLPTYTQYGLHSYPIEPGCYVAVLNRNEGFSPPPYYTVVIGGEFTVP